MMLKGAVSYTGMDHLGAVFDGNLDDLVAGEISSNRGVLAALANDVCLIGLCNFRQLSTRHGRDKKESC